ncbi:MAG: hypothetical protein SGARI_007584 [Bacillariaceae sp.]
MSLIATFDIGDGGDEHDGGGGGTSSSANKKKKSKLSSSSACSSAAKIRHSVYLGGKEDAKDLEKLQQRRISHVLNITPAKTAATSKMGVPNYFEKKFKYLRVPIFDDATSVNELSNQYQDVIVNFIHKALYHGNVLSV